MGGGGVEVVPIQISGTRSTDGEWLSDQHASQWDGVYLWGEWGVVGVRSGVRTNRWNQIHRWRMVVGSTCLPMGSSIPMGGGGVKVVPVQISGTRSIDGE